MTGPVRILLVGGSGALTLGFGLVPQTPGTGTSLLDAGILGCGLEKHGAFITAGVLYANPYYCPEWPEEWRYDIDTQRSDVVAMDLGRWELVDRYHDEHWSHIGRPGFDAYLRSELEEAIEIATQHGADVALMTTPYYQTMFGSLGGVYPENAPWRIDEFDEMLRSVAALYPGKVSVVHYRGMLTPGGEYSLILDGQVARWVQGIHVTDAGAKVIAPHLLESLKVIGLEARSAKNA
jgi:hypothetical protein